ncbi:MAG: beta-ketoacyl-ACP synthase III [Oliverpabstia sp.]|nr:beta-ketoacyl-ACP synthase III [Oliverpabstia sp.]
MKARITGTGSYLPEKIVSNDELAKWVDTSDEWISSRTGIKKRRIAVGETVEGMATEAAKRALENSGTAPKQIQMIIVATCSKEQCFPSIACQVQKAVGAVSAAAFDLSAACSGFLYALNTAHAYIKAGIYKKILIVGTEVLSELVDWKDRSTCVLFGDGAGAVVVEANEQGLDGFVQYADGSKGDVLTCKGRRKNWFPDGEGDMEPTDSHIFMNGQEVFKFAVKKVPECIEQVLEQTGYKKGEIRWYFLHQANSRIIQSVAKRLQEAEEKFPMNLMEYGNTSAASIPILLDEMNRKGELVRGDKVVLSGFGAGLTWAAALLTW